MGLVEGEGNGVWGIAGKSVLMERFRCPCCGYYTLPERGGFDICEVCFWEDDDRKEEYGIDAPVRPEGPNHVHLWQARKNFLEFGAAEARNKRLVRSPKEEEYPENNKR